MNFNLLDISALIESLGIKELFKGKEQKLREFELALITKLSEQNKGQIEINKLEAQSENKFASSWRPMVGYICAFALAYNYILQPLLVLIINIWVPEYELPDLEIEQLGTILITMLGFGGVRTYEKIQLKKIQNENIK